MFRQGFTSTLLRTSHASRHGKDSSICLTATIATRHSTLPEDVLHVVPIQLVFVSYQTQGMWSGATRYAICQQEVSLAYRVRLLVQSIIVFSFRLSQQDNKDIHVVFGVRVPSRETCMNSSPTSIDRA